MHDWLSRNIKMCAAWHQSCKIMTFVRPGAWHTGVVRPRGVKMGNRRLVGTEMKGCYVRDWIVEERDMRISRILYITCVRLINVCYQ